MVERMNPEQVIDFDVETFISILFINNLEKKMEKEVFIYAFIMEVL